MNSESSVKVTQNGDATERRSAFAKASARQVGGSGARLEYAVLYGENGGVEGWLIRGRGVLGSLPR